MTFLTGTGRHRAQIAHFFRGQISSWRPHGVGLVVGKRPYRIRHRCGSLELPESSGTNCQAIHGKMSCMVERIGRLCPEPGRMRRRRLHATTTDPRRARGDLGTANRQDSTKAALGRPAPVDDKNFSRAAPRRHQDNTSKDDKKRLHTTNLGRAALRPDERQVRATFGIRGPAKELGVLVEGARRVGRDVLKRSAVAREGLLDVRPRL